MQVTIPGSLTSISRQAFEECESLTSIQIPDSVTVIGHSAFARCFSLESVALPDSESVGELNGSAFEDSKPVITFLFKVLRNGSCCPLR